MSRDINLTHHLGEWSKRPGVPADGPAPAPGPANPPSAERRLRFDPFAWLAYLLLVLFLCGQFLWLLTGAG